MSDPIEKTEILEDLRLENVALAMQLADNLCKLLAAKSDIVDGPHDCEACGDKPATRIIHDFDEIREEVAMWMEPEDGPWYLCDEHARGAGEPLFK
jgi:hypothetical protein